MRAKKVLVLGGKPIGSCEIVDALKSRGAYVIVSDYLPKEESPAKRIADEIWDISTGDIEALRKKCISEGVDAVLSGVHEFNIQKMAELSEALGLPCYCTLKQQQDCINKESFKFECRRYGLEVAREYTEEEALGLSDDAFPLVVKPVDGSGSRGFTKCLAKPQLVEAIDLARTFGSSKGVLIEEFVDSEALIVHYTMHEGRAIFSGLADKFSLRAGEKGAPIMAFQLAPSMYEAGYLSKCGLAAKRMLEGMGLKEGPVWIEVFVAGGRFIFNEMGYRFGGSMTNYLVEGLCGIDQMSLLIDAALNIAPDKKVETSPCEGLRAIIPMHLKPGHIAEIRGTDDLAKKKYFVALTQVHCVGDDIENWGSAQQVFAYLHLKASSMKEILASICDALNCLSVLGREGEELLYALFDPRNHDREMMPDFVIKRLETECDYLDPFGCLCQ